MREKVSRDMHSFVKLNIGRCIQGMGWTLLWRCHKRYISSAYMTAVNSLVTKMELCDLFLVNEIVLALGKNNRLRLFTIEHKWEFLADIIGEIIILNFN